MRKLILPAIATLLATPALADGPDLNALLRDRAIVLCGWELEDAQARDMLAGRTVSIEQLAREVCARAPRRVVPPVKGQYVR